jgi:hypothetical protein
MTLVTERRQNFGPRVTYLRIRFDSTLIMPDEETRSQHDERETPVPTKRTPLPKFQLFILLLIQFAEPVTGESQ